MRKALAIVLVFALLMLSACSGLSKTPTKETSNVDQTASRPEATTPTEPTPEPTPEPEATTPAGGFVTTTPVKLPLKLQTPLAWVYIDPTEDDLDKLVERLGDAGFAENILKQAKSGDVVFFYDTANYTDAFKSNMNISRQEGIGLEQADLPNVINDIKVSCERDFSKAPFEGFTWLMEPQGKTLGGNYYVVFVANYTAGLPITGVMAYTIYNGALYNFTYSVPQEIYGDAIYANFEKVLSSVEFL